MKGYPKWFNKKFICLLFGVLLVTGLSLFPTFLEFTLEVEVPWRLGNKARSIWAYFHYLVGSLTLMTVGALWSIHMRREWRKKKHLLSGISLTVNIFLLFISATLIQYLGNEELTKLASIAHTLLAGILIIIFPLHLYKKDGQ